MKFLLFILLNVPAITHAAPLVIYGEDNRHEVYQENNPLILTAAYSTAALIGHDKMKQVGGDVSITGMNLATLYRLCPKERFKSQPVAAECSGTLVAPDVIMTAGHCYASENEICRHYSWVFDFRSNNGRESVINVPQENVYRCKKILTKVNTKKDADYALIQLDRPVSDRYPVKFQSRRLGINSPLVMIGHPSGLPTKIADNGFILRIEKDYLLTNLDAFSYNSGSGVFDPMTGEVVGILTGGNTKDYATINDGCSTPRRLLMTEGIETVQKIDPIINFFKASRRR